MIQLLHSELCCNGNWLSAAVTCNFIIHFRTFNLSTFFSALSEIVRGSAIVTDFAKASYVLLIYRNKREFFLLWWSLPATWSLHGLKMSSTTRIIWFSLSIIDYLAFTKKHSLKNDLKGENLINSMSKISKNFWRWKESS